MKNYILMLILTIGLPLVMNSQDFEVFKAGRGGNTSGQMLSRINSDVLSRNPTTTIVLAGTNDFLNLPKLATMAEYEANLREIVDRTLDNGSDVVLMTIPAIVESIWVEDKSDEVLESYEPEGPQGRLVLANRIVSQIASEKGIPLVDIFTLFANNMDFLSNDGVHQTDGGSRAMSSLLYDAIVANGFSVNRVVLLGDSITNRYDDFFIETLNDNPIDTGVTNPMEPTPPTTTDGTLVHITKRNATGFAIDGGTGGTNGQNVTLSVANTSDEGQLWVEIDRGNGFYSYEKFGTNYSLDGNRGGATNQSVYLWQTNATNQNQQWQKQAVGDGGFKLIKRNATGFAINGGSGGVEGRDINMWNSGSTNQNLQWYVTPIASDIRIEAEDFDSMSGIQTEASSESGDNVGYINDGDWIRFDDVNLSGITNMDARVATRTGGGTIEVRTGSVTGTLIGSIDVSNTGGYQNWTTLNTSISNTSGTQDVYLVFTGGNGFLFNVNWIEFNTSSRSNKDIIEAVSVSDVIIYPNPVVSTTTIANAADSIISVYDVNGSIVFTKSILSDTEVIDLSSLPTGIYYTEVNGETTLSIVKIVKN